MTKHQQPNRVNASQQQDVADEQRQEPRMTRKSLIDSLFQTPAATDGKDPMRDLPIGGRRHRPAPVLDEHERKLLAAFQAWMKWPKESTYRERVSSLMAAHEARAFMAGAK
jgi:hypothetical protein